MPALQKIHPLADSATLSPAELILGMAQTLETRTERIAPGLYQYRPGSGPTSFERAAAQEAIARIDQALGTAVTPKRIEQAAEQLYAAMKSRRDDFDPNALADAFLIALDGRKQAAVTEAVRRILRGEADGLSKTFVPTSAELSDLALRIENEWDFRRMRLSRVLELAEMVEEPAPKTLRPKDQALLDLHLSAAGAVRRS